MFRVNLECDVVIVGSGAGGGVVAAELAKSGLDVIVVDKAIYTHPSDYSLGELDSIQSLFEQKGTLQTEDGSMRILAGSVWGGGTTINW
jgi:choline dehydrogenase-like flavoprotein